MKLPLHWLGSYVDVSLPPKQLAERLTMSGTLVERIDNTGSRFEDIVVARVQRLSPHPNADSLSLATLDIGDKVQTVVTGAPNLFEGALVPFIGVGKTLPGQEKPLEGKVLRGIRSEGMVCSARELGLGDDHSGILILDGTTLPFAPGRPPAPGQPLSELFGEWVFELDITPNRPDCLSIYGVAREVAAVTGGALQPLPQPDLTTAAGAPAVTLAIEDPDLCKRISACVISGVTVAPSPQWLVDRLRSAGVRSISNVVDITNFVMLELGQPLHAYDLDTLAGPSLRVRRAHPGEHIVTLDDVDRPLTRDMLVIADDARSVGVAGVMGGQNTEVSDSTRNILLEAATFEARNIRRTSVALGLRTEASTRFEKGLPAALAGKAARRAAALIAELGGGRVESDVLWVGEDDPPAQVITFPLAEVRRLLGVDWPPTQIVANLRSLGFGTEDAGPGVVRVTVPWWREDLEEAADVVEEVARVSGFEAIPETLLEGSVPPRPESPGLRYYWPAREILLGCGLDEGSSSGLTSIRSLELLRPAGSGESWLAEVLPNSGVLTQEHSTFAPVRVVNPLSPEREYLRPTLLAGLLEALRDNLRLGEERVAFFELDVCSVMKEEGLPIERRLLAVALAGLRSSMSWSSGRESFDVFDVKGVIETLLERLGVRRWSITPHAHPLLHPGRAARIEAGGSELGFAGELHPTIAERWDLPPRRAYVAELDFDALAACASPERTFVDYPRQPVAKRDLAVVVDAARSAESVIEEIRRSGKGLLAGVRLFDVYQGDPLPAGKKSLAVALDFQAADRTLKDDELEKAMGRIRRTLEHRLGAEFRA